MSENNTKTAGVDIAEVRRVAELANLELTAHEETSMQRDLSAVLDYIAQLNELDTHDVEPMAQVSEVLNESGAEAKVLRQDVLVPSLDRKPVMEQAPETDGVFFKVPKVIER